MGTVQQPDVEDHLTLEQLSALLDEESPDDARAHAETCQRCSALRERLRAAREVIRDDVALPAEAIERAVAAGVGAMGSSNVVSLTERRRRNPLPWLAGVAAALVGVLGLAALVNGGDDRQDADTFAVESAEPDAALDDGVQDDGGTTARATADGEEDLFAGQSGGSTGGAGGASAPAPLRAFDSEEQVVDYLRESAVAMSTTATSCQSEATASLGVPLERLRSEDVTWQDGSGSLWVDPAERRAVLMRPGGCSLLADLRY